MECTKKGKCSFFTIDFLCPTFVLKSGQIMKVKVLLQSVKKLKEALFDHFRVGQLIFMHSNECFPLHILENLYTLKFYFFVSKVFSQIYFHFDKETILHKI